MLKRFRSFLTAAARHRRLEREMSEEWRHHIEARADDLVASGVSREAALRQARREFGDPLRWREESREARGLGWLQDIATDARYAVRQWRQAPVFTLTAIVTIALGIGASTTIFSVVDAVVLRRLPFVASDQLVMVNRAPGGDPSRLQPRAAIAEFREWKTNQDTFAELAAISSAVATLKEGDNPAEDLRVTYVSTNLLDMLGVGPRIGRAFDEDDEVLSRGTVALISDGFWKSYFGGVPEVLGRRISIDGMPREIIGVMPAGTSYPLFADRTTALTQVWLPLLTEGWSKSVPGSPSAVDVIGRLNPGISPELAARRMEQQFPMPADRQRAYQEGYRAGAAAAAMAEAFGGAARGVTVEERPLTMAALPVVDHLVGERTRSWMWLLLGAVLLVLLIACANVAGLLLARMSARQHEIGVRATIGASRLRIVRQLLVESLVLSGTGAVLGLALAWWGIEGLTAAMPASLPRTTEISLDMRVLGVAVAASLSTGLLFGLLPAWHGSRPDVTRTLGDGARTITGSRSHGRLRGALVTLELALTVVLLVGAGLFVTSFMKLMRVDLGFEPERVLTARVAVVQRPLRTGRSVSPLDFVNRLRVIPGVESAALVAGTGFPLQMSYAPILIMGSDRTTAPRAYLRSYVTADYHRVFKSSLLEGRYFEDEDIYWQRPVALLSEEAARTLFPEGKAAGQQLEIEGPSPRTVVGVVRDVRAFSDRGTAGRLVYLPIPHDESRGHVVMRTSGDPIALVPAVRFAAQEVLGDVPLRDVRSMTSIVSGWDAERRLTMLLLAGFGGLGLVIAVIGVYGLVAYVAAQRTHEVGVRMALGATSGQIVTMFVRSAIWITLAGLALGTVVAWWFSSAATAFLFELEATDPRVFAIAIATLALAAITAAVIPARRAASIDPVSALRQ